MLSDEYRYKILRLLKSNPKCSQRELAKALGISLGKVNFCLNALIEKGHLKVSNFRNNKNKLSYMYLLTPHGLEEKSSLTIRFLKYKLKQRETLLQEIEALRQEVLSLNEKQQNHE